MSRKIIDTDLLSKEREDVFDIYFNKIEELKIELVRSGKEKKDYPNFNLIERSLAIIERNLDDLAEEKNSGLVELGNSEIIQSLKYWFEIFEQLGDRKSFIEDFSYNLIAISAVLSKLKDTHNIDFRKYIKYLSPSRSDKEAFKKEISKSSKSVATVKVGKLTSGTVVHGTSSSVRLIDFSEVEKIEKEPEIHLGDPVTVHFAGQSGSYSVSRSSIEVAKDTLASEIKKRKKDDVFPSLQYELIEVGEIEDYRAIINNSDIVEELETIRQYPEGTSYDWDLLIRVDNPDNNYQASQIGFLIWSIAEALEKIDGVKVILEDLGTGSRWFKLKTKIRDEIAKEEVKEVLDKSKEALKSQYLEKPIEEAKKLKAEREKIEKEKNIILSKSEAKETNRLQMKKLHLENEAMRVKIMKDKIELINGISQLIANGIVKNDSNIQVLINDLLYIEKTEDEIIEGEDIEIIEEDQIVNIPKLKEPQDKKE